MDTSEPPVKVEADLEAPTMEVWQAITEPTQMRHWFFDTIPDFKPEVGFTTEFMVYAGERQFLHQWEVITVEPQQKLAYRWRYAGYAGSGQSVFELTGDGDTSHLQVTFVIEEDFAAVIPEFERDACLGGWQYFIAELGRYLATR